jgi:hypothetical protein
MVAWAQSTGDQEYPVLRRDEPRIVVECFMRLDRLDFLVENLSRFWKNKCTQVFSPEPVPYKFISSSLAPAIHWEGWSGSKQYNLRETIAFLPFESRRKPQQVRNLTILSLAATVASTILVGFGTSGSIKIHLLSVKANSDWTTEGSQRWRQWTRIQQEYG